MNPGDIVLGRVPADAAAARVTSPGRSEREVGPKPQKQVVESDFFLPFAPLTHRERRIAGVPRCVGRLTVMGLAPSTPKRNGARYVVRCGCGRWEHRKAKVLKAPETGELNRMCRRCAYTEHLRWKSNHSPSVESWLGGNAS